MPSLLEFFFILFSVNPLRLQLWLVTSPTVGRGHTPSRSAYSTPRRGRAPTSRQCITMQPSHTARAQRQSTDARSDREMWCLCHGQGQACTGAGSSNTRHYTIRVGGGAQKLRQHHLTPSPPPHRPHFGQPYHIIGSMLPHAHPIAVANPHTKTSATGHSPPPGSMCLALSTRLPAAGLRG